MKNKILYIVICFVMILLGISIGLNVKLLVDKKDSEIPKLENGVVVSLKGNMSITENQLYEYLKDDYALDAFINLLDKTILEDKYKDKLSEAKEYADDNISQLKDYYGDELTSAIQQNTNFSSIEGYQDYIYITYLQNIAIEDYCRSKVSDIMIKTYFVDYESDFFELSHILIKPDINDSMTDDEKEKHWELAKNKANLLLSELNLVDDDKIAETFAKMAKKESMDNKTSKNGGSFGVISKDSNSINNETVLKQGLRLKNGKYSEVIKSDEGYHIVFRNNPGEITEKSVREEIKDILGEKVLENNPEYAVAALENLRDDYDIDILDKELKKQYNEYMENLYEYYDSFENNQGSSS